MLPKNIDRRLSIFSFVILAIFVVLVTRVGYLQLVKGKYYQQLAETNSIRLIPVNAPRGVIYDRYSSILVSNNLGFTVTILHLSEEPIPDEVITKLSEILAMDKGEVTQKIKQAESGSFEPVRLKVNVDAQTVARIEERRSELPGVFIEIQPIRQYVFGELAAHTLGYVGEINAEELEALKDKGYKQGDIIGKTGLEKVYDQYLRGVDGGKQVEVDVSGRPVNVLGEKQPIPGNNLFLTIDTRLQKAAEQAMDEQLKELRKQGYGAQGAAVVVLNPQTGEVLAIASKPSFDPNIFARGITYKEWENLNKPPYPLNNLALAGEYPPGSVFKIVTATAALAEGKTKADEMFYCSGVSPIPPFKNCWLAGGHGSLNLVKAIEQSCNVVFYELGNRLGVDKIKQYAEMYGLGQKTGINLPGESEGLVPSKEYKEEVYGEEWYPSETLDVAIGQGLQQYTPLQIAELISTVANGGTRYQPYLVSKIAKPDGTVLQTFEPKVIGKVDVPPEVFDVLKQGLRNVVKDGTAAGAFDGFTIPVAGKTGTAENPHGSAHAWFAGFAPADNPRIAVAVVVDQGGHGGSAAAPIARKVFEAAFNVEQAKEPTDLAVKMQTTP